MLFHVLFKRHPLTKIVQAPLVSSLSSFCRIKMADEATRKGMKQTEHKTAPGIVYLSRLPPFMKPAKVRYTFAQFGEIGRLFLQPEGKKFACFIGGLIVCELD